MTYEEQIAIQAYDRRMESYLPDEATVRSLLAETPLNVEKLRPYASKVFDSLCTNTSKVMHCYCVYCDVRRALGVDIATMLREQELVDLQRMAATRERELAAAEQRGYEHARRLPVLVRSAS